MREWKINTKLKHDRGVIDVIEYVNLEELREFIKQAKRAKELEPNVSKTSLLIIYAIKAADIEDDQLVEKIEIEEIKNGNRVHT